MEPFSDYIQEYRNQLEKGAIQQAYKGLMEYMLGLRTHFKNKCPDYFVSSNIYFGYMDMTYFSCVPQSLQERKLKAAVVFIHPAFRFEVWLAGYNKQVQSKYWKLFKESGWNQYHLVPTTECMDSILECILADNPDFRDLDALTAQIEEGTLKFIQDVEGFLSVHEN